MPSLRVTFDPAKLADVVLFILSRCPPDRIGAVKLHKVLYFSDMIRFVQNGQALTGAVYRKRPYGPTCEPLPTTLRELEVNGAITIGIENYHGFKKKTFHLVGDAHASNRISRDEANLLTEAIEFVCFDNTAKTISEFSHNRVWSMVEMGDELPYESALLILPEDISAAAFEWPAEDMRTIETLSAEQLSFEPVGHH